MSKNKSKRKKKVIVGGAIAAGVVVAGGLLFLLSRRASASSSNRAARGGATIAPGSPPSPPRPLPGSPPAPARWVAATDGPTEADDGITKSDGSTTKYILPRGTLLRSGGHSATLLGDLYQRVELVNPTLATPSGAAHWTIHLPAGKILWVLDAALTVGI